MHKVQLLKVMVHNIMVNTDNIAHHVLESNKIIERCNSEIMFQLNELVLRF